MSFSDDFMSITIEDTYQNPCNSTIVTEDAVIAVLAGIYAVIATIIAGIIIKSGSDKKKAEQELKKNLPKIKEAYIKTQDILIKELGKNAKYVKKASFKYTLVQVNTKAKNRDDGRVLPYYISSPMINIDVDSIFQDCYGMDAQEYDISESKKKQDNGEEYDPDVCQPAPKAVKIIKEILSTAKELSSKVKQASKGTISLVPYQDSTDENIEFYYASLGYKEYFGVSFDISFDKSGVKNTDIE